ncbi:MAG: SDR family NAD(P)-dependent oxidoreductase [Myxococcota bacterium]
MSDTVAVVTGASSGIGRALSETLARRGHRVLGVARRAEALATLARAWPQVSPYATDLCSAAARAELVAKMLAEHATPAYVILNAGLAHYGRLERLTWAEVAEQIEVNVVAVVDLTRRLLPALLAARRGRILIISSVLGLGAVPYAATYAATKHAMNGFVRALRLDLRGSGVSVSAVCPAGVRTAFSANATGVAGSHRSGQEPLDRVVHGIVRQLDCDRAVLYPTAKSRWLGTLLRYLPSVADWYVYTVSRGAFERQLLESRR